MVKGLWGMAEQAKGEVVPILEQRRQHWKKKSLDRRISFLVREGGDPEILKAASPDELVQYCLIIEGLLAGTFPRKKVIIEVAAPIDPMEYMKLMVQQMKEEREAADRRAKEEREAADRRMKEEREAAKAKREAEKAEREA